MMELESHLTLRSYVAGYSLSLADIAIWGALRGNKVATTIRRNCVNISRWFELIEISNPWVTAVVADLNSACHTAEKGRESAEFQDSILRDLTLLGIQPDRTSYSSDYFQQMYDGCVRLIQLGKAYADNAPKDIMGDQRGKDIPSARRDMGIEDSLAQLEKIKAGLCLEWCIRAKISVDGPVKCLRDPVIYRCNLQPHHRTGTTWRIYPTYDFSAPFLDSLEGVTHALRTNEYRDRNPQYHWIQEALDMRRVDIWDFSRINFVRTELSKRKLAFLVHKGVVWDWDDPRMPTIRGIRRRGMRVPALREFILKQGPSQNVIKLDWTSFWATNKKYIDPVAARYTAIPKQNAVTVTVHAVDETSSADKPKHNKNAALGTKKVFFSRQILLSQEDTASFKPNEEITLMNWGNAIITNISTNQHGIVSGLELRLHLQGDFKKTDKKITWLAKEESNMIPVDLVDFDYLITKEKLEKDDDFASFLTPKTEFCNKALADCDVTSLVRDDIIQFDRIGYFRVDQAYQEGKPAVFFRIPTGKGA